MPPSSRVHFLRAVEDARPYKLYPTYVRNRRGELRSPAGGHRPPLRILSDPCRHAQSYGVT